MAFHIQRPASAFSLDPSRKKQGGRKASPDHLKWIRTLPCLVTGSRTRVEAAHVRYGSPVHGKPAPGMGVKPDDKWVVPLAAHVHREGPDAQHGQNEAAWWEARGIDPLDVALRLFAASGDDEVGELIIREARARTPRK